MKRRLLLNAAVFLVFLENIPPQYFEHFTDIIGVLCQFSWGVETRCIASPRGEIDAMHRVSTVTMQKGDFETPKNFPFYRKSVVLRRFFEIFIFKQRFGV